VWPMWKLEPPARLRVSDEGSKEKLTTARRVETELSASSPTALPDHADLPDSKPSKMQRGELVVEAALPFAKPNKTVAGGRRP
jgi:hypothetical protein